MDQLMTASEPTIKSDLNVSEILDDLLYRSSKHNPNREILVAAGVGHKHCNYNNTRSQSRQRHPALLLSATKDDSITTTGRSAKHMNTNNGPTGGQNGLMLSRQTQQNNYWNQFPSESEFDTTRIDNYLNALNLSRRHRNPKATSATAATTAVDKRSAKHVRSRSVDTTLTRLRLSIHKPVNSFLHSLANPSSGAKTMSSSVDSAAIKSHAVLRNGLVTRSESLNSEGSSLSGESVGCEFNSSNSPAKSVLKKKANTASAAATAAATAANTAVHLGNGKKNVTFSAFATIQVMDG